MPYLMNKGSDKKSKADRFLKTSLHSYSVLISTQFAAVLEIQLADIHTDMHTDTHRHAHRHTQTHKTDYRMPSVHVHQ